MGVSVLQLVWEVAWNIWEIVWSILKIVYVSAGYLWEAGCMLLELQSLYTLMWLVGCFHLATGCVRIVKWIISEDQRHDGAAVVNMRRKTKDNHSVREKVNCYESSPRTENELNQSGDVFRRSNPNRFSWNDFENTSRDRKLNRRSWNKEEEGQRKFGEDIVVTKRVWKKDWCEQKYVDRSRNCDKASSEMLNVINNKKHSRNKSWDSRNTVKFTYTKDIDIGEKNLLNNGSARSRDDVTITYNLQTEDKAEECDISQDNINCDIASDNPLDDSLSGEDELDTRGNYNQDILTFCSSCDMVEVLHLAHKLSEEAQISPGPFTQYFPKLKSHFESEIPYKYKELLAALEKKARGKEYVGNKVAQGKKILIIGAGPCGLRMAMEAQFLGAKTTVIEKRNYINRNNILKLWAFVMEDLKMLGAKKIWPGLGNGSVNHVSIRILQLILLKMTLLLGAEIRTQTTYNKIIEPQNGRGWRVTTTRKDELKGDVEDDEEFDVVIGATGTNVQIEGFERRSLDAKMAIAITANFVNNRTREEVQVKEIPGLSKQYDLAFFKGLETETGINLENIVYYQDLTHYFVMTAKKESLLKKRVIISDKDVDRESLLHPDNIDNCALEEYAVQAATYSTKNFSKMLPQTCFAQWKGRNDVSIFDFTNLYASTNACRIKEKEGKRLLLAMVGDSLVQPFWPEGTGVGRGFLSVLDAAWLVKQFCQDEPPLHIIREREKLYSLMRQTSDNKLKCGYREYTINPSTRYPTTSFPFKGDKIHHLYETDFSDSDQIDGVVLRKKSDSRQKRRDKTLTTFFSD